MGNVVYRNRFCKLDCRCVTSKTRPSRDSESDIYTQSVGTYPMYHIESDHMFESGTITRVMFESSNLGGDKSGSIVNVEYDGEG